MFLNQVIKHNPPLIEYAFKLHQSGQILPDTYVIDMDSLETNAIKILNEAKKHDIDLYFMLKQVGRNPYIAKRLIELGYKGAVVVDYKEALIMKKNHIPISNIGHLVQTPKALVDEFVEYGVEYFTTFSLDKIIEINNSAKKYNKIQKILLKVVGPNDIIYSGQTAGFNLDELSSLIPKVKELKNILIDGVTSFPCFLYNDKNLKIEKTPNFKTLLEAKKILEENGIKISNINAPSTTSVITLKQMNGYDVNSGEPGHGLTGTTPIHAYQDLDEIPSVVYVSEVSHNFNGLGYCYGGGHYRRSHVINALVGSKIDTAKKCKVITPNDESIDYYFGLDEKCDINSTVIMAFRFQIFVTRSDVCLVSGLKNNQPKVVGVYTSQGELNG